MPKLDIYVGSIGPAFSYMIYVPRTILLPARTLYYREVVRLKADVLRGASVTLVVVTDTTDVSYFNTVRRLFGEAIYDQLVESKDRKVRLKRENTRSIEVTDQQVADINEELFAAFAS